MINKTSKEFSVKVDGSDIVLYFKRPSVEELKEIDLEYRKIYAEAVRQGVMTESEARKRLQESSAWTKEDDGKINDLSFKVALLVRELEKLEDMQKGIEIVTEISDLRAQVIELIRNKTELFNNTAEGLANDQRMHKFIELCCIRKEDGEKFFEDRKTYELFVSSNTEELSEIYKQASFFEYGTPEDQTSNWPEVKWMKQHQEDFVKVDNKKNKKRKRVKKVG